MDEIIKLMGLLGAVVLPLFNIPLIYRVIQRKSSDDLSLIWVVGVWSCIVLMTPAGFVSQEVVWRIYSYFNVTLFTGVLIVAVKYRTFNGKANNEQL